MTLIDIHSHLDQIENVDEVLRDSNEAGVESVIAVGVDLASSKKNLEIKRRTQTPKVYLAFGIHPGEIKAEEVDAALKFFEENIAEVVAIGEIGLDFWYRWVRKNDEKKDEQRAVFGRQLELAQKYDLPVIVHSRGAWKECLEMMKAQKIRRGVFHWYSGPVEVLQEILDAGFYVSSTPALAYSPQLRDAMLNTPIERALIETDCPVFFRGNEADPGFYATPQDVFRTLDEYAKLTKIDPAKAAEIFNHNARTVFGLA